MNRLWSRIGVRVASVGLLLTGVAGGVYLGQDREVQQQQVVQRSLVLRADAAEMDLLKERHNAHAAARAPQRQAEAEAAAKAATEAKAAAGKARKIQKVAIAKKAADEKAAEEAKKTEKAKKTEGGSSSGSGESGGGFTGPIPTSCSGYSGARKVGCAVLLSKGFGLAQMPCLDKLWTKESGWNPRARNPSSGAYGIPQAYPGNKMASAGADWKTNPATQVEWGLGYIKGRYGTPCGAWSHSQNKGWY